MGYHILIAEDEPKLLEILCDYFLSRGDEPVAADNGEAALELAMEQRFDAVLLDIMMPRLDGLSVCRVLRKTSNVPILFLTALSDEEDRLQGYALGADDYISKPFSMAVMYAKLTALISRSRGNLLSTDLITAGALDVRLSSREVLANGRPVHLTAKEYDLLLYLLYNKNTVLSRDRILEKCWGFDYEGTDRVVDTCVKRLRRKLGSAVNIRTAVGSGYCLEVK